MSTPTAKTPGYGTFRGRVACDCLIEWLPAYEAELQRRGILNGPLTIYQLTGSAAASGGTHGQGGAADIVDLPGGDEEVAVARQMGADATWARKQNWDGKGGIAHLHAVLRGCPHNAPARYQIDAVDDDFNGLGRGGRGGPDTGPRPLSGRTWREGIAWARRQQEEDDMYTDEDRKIARATLDELRALRTAESKRFAIERERGVAMIKLARGTDKTADEILDEVEGLGDDKAPPK